MLFFCAALACGLTAACTGFGVWPLAWGRYLVGELVTWGPAVFVLAAVLYAAAAFGLLWLKHWARRLAIVMAAVGLYFVIAPVSSAVADLRLGAIAFDGAQIVLRVIVLWYLLREDVAERFGTVISNR